MPIVRSIMIALHASSVEEGNDASCQTTTTGATGQVAVYIKAKPS